MPALEKAASDLIETDVDDETIIVSLESGQLFSVKNTSRDIWKLIDGKRGRPEIIKMLSAKYEADHKVISADFDRFIDEIAGANLLKEAGH